MLKQGYLSLPCNVTLEGLSCGASLTLIIFTTSKTVMKDMKSTFQYFFDVPACCFNPSSKTVMHSMKATSAYVNQTMIIFFFIKSRIFFVKI